MENYNIFFGKICAINLTNIKVTFSDKVADFTVDNISAPGITFSNPVLADDGMSVTVTVDGVTFDSTHDITVTGVANAEGTVAADYTETVIFGGVNQYYDLQFAFDATDNNENDVVDIEATGATTVQVTATVVDKDGNTVDTTGVIRFDTTRGGIAQNEKTLQSGVASIQLTSEASLTSNIFANISATIVGDYELEGLKGNTMVEFVAPGGDADPNEAVPVVNVESNQADRFFITLGSAKADLTDDQLADIANAIDVTDGISGNFGGAGVGIQEVIQKSDKVLEVILDSDDDETLYLTDNAQHLVDFGAVEDVIAATNGVEFTLTDTTKQFVLDVEAIDQRTLEVTFAEQVAWDTDSNLAIEDANNPANYLIDGDSIDPTTIFELSDDRKVVTINLVAGDTLTVTDNNLEISNIGDWAGKTDANNCISTQLISFEPIIDETIPTATITRQSPEQFLVEFSADVRLTDTADLSESLADAIRVYYGEDVDEDGLLDTQYDTDNDFATNGTTGILFTAFDDDTVEADPVNNYFNKVLVELEKDWTQEDGTGSDVDGDDATGDGLDAYWVDANPLQFVIPVDAVETMLGNKNLEVDESIVNNRDRTSQDIIDFTQNTDADGNLLGTATAIMSEPVQVNVQTTPLTPNPTQVAENGAGTVQAGEIVFEKDGVTVDGEVSAISADDYTLTIQANDGAGNTGFDALTAGTWTVSITGISDDYGNTMDTQEYTFEVPAAGSTDPMEAEAEVMYATYTNADNYDSSDVDKDVIRIKFTKTMSNVSAKAVGDTTNYILNGETLADLGSSIRKGIDGITDEWDGITILLPEGTLGTDANFVLTIASNLESADGDVLVPGTNELDFVDTDLGVDTTDTSDYLSGNLVAYWDGKVTDITVTDGPTNAKLLNDSDDDIEITFTDVLDALDIEQVRVNGTLISEGIGAGQYVADDTTDTITISMEGLNIDYDTYDRVEVTINGQTFYVETVE